MARSVPFLKVGKERGGQMVKRGRERERDVSNLSLTNTLEQQEVIKLSAGSQTHTTKT